MTKITGLQTGDKLQKFVLYTAPASENQIKCKGAGHVTSMAK